MKIKTHLLAELDAGEFSRPDLDTHCPNLTKESKGRFRPEIMQCANQERIYRALGHGPIPPSKKNKTNGAK